MNRLNKLQAKELLDLFCEAFHIITTTEEGVYFLLRKDDLRRLAFILDEKSPKRFKRILRETYSGGGKKGSKYVEKETYYILTWAFRLNYGQMEALDKNRQLCKEKFKKLLSKYTKTDKDTSFT